MISDSIFIGVYALVPVIATGAFIPQIIKLLKPETGLDGISFGAWWAWMLSATISLIYGVFYLHDFMFILSSSVAFFFNIVVLVLAHIKQLRGPRLKIDSRIDHDINNIADQMHDQGYKREYIQSSQHNRIITVNHALIPEQPQTIQ